MDQLFQNNQDDKIMGPSLKSYIVWLALSDIKNEKFVGWCPPTQTPTQKLKIGFSMFSSQEIESGLQVTYYDVIGYVTVLPDETLFIHYSRFDQKLTKTMNY